jgi:hypothetical protein
LSYVATKPLFYSPPYRGMGDAISQYQAGASSTSKNIQAGGAIASGVTVAAVGAIAANLAAQGAGATIMGLTSATLSAAVPFIGPALMAATLLVQYLVANSGCGITCVETSEWADQAAAALQQVMDGYFALPAPRTQTQKALAVANFNTIWQQLVAACGQAGTGNAGVRCISDRQSGACTWKQKYAPVYPGQPNIGDCWNWFSGYLQPIQQDPVVSDATAVSAGGTTTSGGSFSLTSSGGSSSLLPLLLIGGLVVWGLS